MSDDTPAKIVYPSKFPRPLVRGFNYYRKSTFLRTRMEAGTVRQRKQYTKEFSYVTFILFMTKLQLDLFEAFYRYKLKEGLLWFYMNLNSTEEEKVRFFKDYRVSSVGGSLYRIKVSLEIDNLSVLPRSVYDAEVDKDHTSRSFKDLEAEILNVRPITLKIVDEVASLT